MRQFWDLRYPRIKSTVHVEKLGIYLPLQKLKGHSDSVRSVAFSSDGKLVTLGSGDETANDHCK
jgi:WD40 repeat protein